MENEKLTKEDSYRKDEYMGQYKEIAEQTSEEDKFGESQNPVQNTPTPWKNLRSTGG
jgi:hypothetical protein